MQQPLNAVSDADQGGERERPGSTQWIRLVDHQFIADVQAREFANNSLKADYDRLIGRAVSPPGGSAE